jgi:hypothetical protein
MWQTVGVPAAVGDVFGFVRVHRIGSVCGFPCKQCDPEGRFEWHTEDAHGRLLPDTPLFILGEATQADWIQRIEEKGGTVTAEDLATEERDHPFYYFVSAD